MRWLEAAERALQAGSVGEALRELLEAWRHRRLPELADLVDRLSAGVTRALPPLAARTRKGLHQQWLDLANERNPIDLGRLLAHFEDPPWVSVGERVELLSSLDDPRVTKAFAAFVERLPTVGGIGTARWTLLFDRLEKSNDGRARAALEARLAIADPRVVVTEQLQPLCRQVLTALAELTPSVEEVRRLAEVRAQLDRALLEPLPNVEQLRASGKRASARSEADLLQLIYETPEDDGPRLVYGDWLQEQGSPRAELLLLQLKPRPTGKEQARARQLVREHGRLWLGPLESALRFRTEVFSRGFVAEGALEFKTPQQRASLVGHPAWNTLTTLVSGRFEPAFLEGTELRGLERLEHADLDDLEAMERRATPLRRLRQLSTEVGLDRLRALSPAMLPALRALEWVVSDRRDPEAITALIRQPPAIFRQLERLVLVSVRTPEVLAALSSLPQLKVVELHSSALLTFVRDDGGWVMEVAPTPYLVRVHKGWIDAARLETELVPLLRRFTPHVAAVRAPATRAWANGDAAVLALALKAITTALEGTNVELRPR